MTDIELNEAVAKRLGWTDIEIIKNTGLRDEMVGLKNGFNDAQYPFGRTVPAYSTEIQEAWEIVEHVKKSGHKFRLEFTSYCNAPRRWHTDIYTKTRNGAMTTYMIYEAQADTAPRAICEAFLKLP